LFTVRNQEQNVKRQAPHYLRHRQEEHWVRETPGGWGEEGRKGYIW